MTEKMTESPEKEEEENPRPLFANRSVLDVKTAARALARQTRPALLFGIAMIVCALIPLGIALYARLYPESGLSTEGAVAFATLFGLLGALLLILAIGGRRTAEKTASLGTPVIIFEGYRDKFTADVSRGQSKFGTFTRGDWFLVSSVREYADMWQIFYEGTNFTLLKSGMKEGSAEEFAAFLRSKVGVKYKIKYKNK